YLRLHWMALDYLSITLTSINVECTFSQGRLVLSHVHNCLSIQSTRALMCLGVWSLMGYVHDNDVKAAAVLPEIDEEDDLLIDWDMIL
ncbi:hypothetical protein K443DRAFT_107256, partial [Laccaria amethystina LaAM-08-1]